MVPQIYHLMEHKSLLTGKCWTWSAMVRDCFPATLRDAQAVVQDSSPHLQMLKLYIVLWLTAVVHESGKSFNPKFQCRVNCSHSWPQLDDIIWAEHNFWHFNSSVWKKGRQQNLDRFYTADLISGVLSAILRSRERLLQDQTRDSSLSLISLSLTNTLFRQNPFSRVSPRIARSCSVYRQKWNQSKLLWYFEQTLQITCIIRLSQQIKSCWSSTSWLEAVFKNIIATATQKLCQSLRKCNRKSIAPVQILFSDYHLASLAQNAAQSVAESHFYTY